MKSSQTKKMSAVLAAMAVLWGGGTLFFGGDSVSAAVDKATVLKKVTGVDKNALTPEEQTWFNQFFGGSTLQGGTTGVTSAEKTWIQDVSDVLSYEDDGLHFNINGENGPILRASGNGSATGIQLGKGNRDIERGTEIDSQGIVFGDDNLYAGASANTNILGHQNVTLNYRRDTIGIGYQNTVQGGNSIGIGMLNHVVPDDLDLQYPGRTTSNALAIGVGNLVNGDSIAMGHNTVGMGELSIAIGYNANAGIPGTGDYLKDKDEPIPAYAKYLQEHFPDKFGAYDASQEEYDRRDQVNPILIKEYGTWLGKFGISSYDDLVKKAGNDYANRILMGLGWKYALTQTKLNGPVAIGGGAHAYSDGALSLGYQSEVLADHGVALGANARATEEDMVADGTKAPFSEITLSTKGTEVKGINEYLLGPVAIGGKQSGNTSAVYLRQLKYVADGTADTDAVNLRQLKAAVGNNGTTGSDNGGSGNSGSSIVYEAGDNITITDGKNDHTKVISATGITDIKNQVTDLNGRVDKVEDSMNTMNHRLTKLDRRVDKVGAGAAALAALHPLDFDPDNKWDIAGGYGHYAGQSAMALGAYYRPNEDVMFSIGGAFGNGEDMINAGVSVKVGSGESKPTTSKAAMAKKINELQQVVTTQHQQLEEQKADMAKQDAKIAAQENEIKELKAMMQQILAK